MYCVKKGRTKDQPRGKGGDSRPTGSRKHKKHSRQSEQKRRRYLYKGPLVKKRGTEEDKYQSYTTRLKGGKGRRGV